MEEIKRKTHQTNKPKKPSFFLCCFGFSSKQYFPEKNPPNKNMKKSIQRFSWPRFRVKNASTKTVPVDTAAATTNNTASDHTKALNCDQSRPSKPKLKWTFKRRSPYGIQAIAKVETDQSPTDVETRHGLVPEINLGNTKNLDHSPSLNDATCRKRLSSYRRRDSRRTGMNQTQLGSAQLVSKPNRTAELSHSASFQVQVTVPVPSREMVVTKHVAHSQVMLKKPPQENKGQVSKSNTMVGMSIIIVTLIIMVLWGRLCAILCTSAWFYFVPRFRYMTANSNNSSGGENDSNENDLDLNSEEYKKKVVFEGFLKRNHKISFQDNVS